MLIFKGREELEVGATTATTMSSSSSSSNSSSSRAALTCPIGSSDDRLQLWPVAPAAAQEQQQIAPLTCSIGSSRSTAAAALQQQHWWNTPNLWYCQHCSNSSIGMHNSSQQRMMWQGTLLSSFFSISPNQYQATPTPLQVGSSTCHSLPLADPPAVVGDSVCPTSGKQQQQQQHC
jgi:hypothetical protein